MQFDIEISCYQLSPLEKNSFPACAASVVFDEDGQPNGYRIRLARAGTTDTWNVHIPYTEEIVRLKHDMYERFKKNRVDEFIDVGFRNLIVHRYKCKDGREGYVGHADSFFFNEEEETDEK